MADRYRLTDVATVEDAGSWVFTGRHERGERVEVVVVPCERPDGPPVEAWINRCTHEDQRLYREPVGLVRREGDIVCPKHGSLFDPCSGGCDNGPAAGTSLLDVDLAVEEGQIYLVDEAVDYRSAGVDRSADGDDDDDGPRSTSHLRF